MGDVIWLFVLLSALIAFVIAAVAVGSVTAAQATKARPAVYDLNEAVEFVGDRLAPEITAEISYDDVRQVLLWHLDFLEDKGVASYRTDAAVHSSMVVVTDDEPIASSPASLAMSDTAPKKPVRSFQSELSAPATACMHSVWLRPFRMTRWIAGLSKGGCVWLSRT